MNIHMEDIHRATYVGWNSHALCGSTSALKAPQTLYFGIFLEVSSHGHDRH